MSISYLSTPVKSSSYVPSLDLGLYSKVLSIKQEKYDLGVQQEQSKINDLANLDVRPVDKPYLNDKINNLVSTVNNFGGQDYGDPNVLNQIEGLGSDIYGDQKVLTAVSSMKEVRSLTSNYEKYKTDPKLSKLYAPQNEWDDMSHVNQWMNNPEVGAAYSGPSAPTPYVPWQDNQNKRAAQIKADKYESTMQDGFYIDKVSGVRVTPDRVEAEAAENMLPQERDQMNRDGNYLYKDTPPEQIIQKGISQVNQKYNDATNLNAFYTKQAEASISDPEQRLNFLRLAHDQSIQMASLAKDPMYTADAAIKAYQANPKEFVGQVYRNEAFKGLADVYSYNQSTTEQKPNTVAMYMDRKAQAEKQFDEKMAQEDSHFYTDLNWKAFEKGLQMIIDPKTRALSYVPLGSTGTGGLQSTTINTQDPEDLKVTDQSLKSASDSLDLQKQAIFQRTFSNIIQHHPELGHIVPSLLSPTGQTGELYGQEYLEWYNGKPGLQPEDLAIFEKNPNGSYKNPGIVANYQNAVKAAGQDPTEAMKFMTQQYQNYQTVLNGQGHTVGELNPDFVDAANQVQLINERQRTIGAIQKQAADLVSTQAGWNQQQKDLYSDYLAHPDKYTTTGYAGGAGGGSSQYSTFKSDPASQSVANLIQNLDKKNINKDKITQQFYNTQSTRDVFQTHIFANTEGDVKNREAANYMQTEMTYGRADVYVGGKKLKLISGKYPFQIVDPSKIKPIQAGMTSDGSGRFFIQGEVNIGTDATPSPAEVIVHMDASNASKFGLSVDPAENINYSVNHTGTTGDLNIYGDNNIAVTAQIKKKNLSDLNDFSSFSVVKIYSKDQNGNIIPNKYTIVPVPGTDAVTPADAWRSINTVIQNAAAINKDRVKNGLPPGTQQDFYNWIIQNRKP